MPAGSTVGVVRQSQESSGSETRPLTLSLAIEQNGGFGGSL
jgi:hypothetical protein